MSLNENFYLIGVGASAGGLEALSDFLAHLPKSLLTKTAVVVAQHLSPNYRSMLVQILSKEATFPVKEAEHNSDIEIGHIYITPPDYDVQIHRNKLVLSKPRNMQGPKPSVDLLLNSLAEEFKEHSIGIILSGTGSDGSKGIVKVKEQGGLTIIQNPDTAKYDGMPISALQTGVIDYSLPADIMGEKIESFIHNGFKDEEPTAHKTELEQLFSLIHERFGIEFSHYKSSTIMRRIDKCMKSRNINELGSYVTYLKDNQEALQELYDSFLINVTSFFRDNNSYIQLERVLLQKMKQLESGSTLRVWIPGVSTGEEAYSIAFTIQHLLDTHPDITMNYQLFATDIDDQALQIARRGLYSADQVLPIPEELKKTYLAQVDRGFEVVKQVRNKILFSKHDVTINPPFLKIDLISCRNLLIYLDSDLQRQIFPVFHYALKDSGILFLGKSESANLVNDLFDVIDSKSKIFKKRAFSTQAPTIKFSKFKPLGFTGDWEKKRQSDPTISFRTRVLETLNELIGNSYLVTNTALDILETKGDISFFLQIPEGQLNLNINRLLRKEVQLDVKNLLFKVIKEKQQQSTPIKRYHIDAKLVYIRFSASYLISDSNGIQEDLLILLAEKIQTEDWPLEETRPQDGSESDNKRIADLENELRINKEQLQTYIEEIETTNEELQSLNEELQSSNEELQSVNEELETGNEELQSSNEELQTAYSEIKHINDELIQKEIELEKTNSLFITQFENTKLGNLLLDGVEQLVLINKTAKEMFKRVGITGIRSNFPLKELLSTELYEQLHEFINTAETQKQPITNQLVIEYNTKLFYYDCIIECVYSSYPYRSLYFSISMFDATESKKQQEKLHKSNEMLSSILESNSHFLIRTDMEGKYTYVNRAFCEKFGFRQELLLGQYYGPTVHPDDHKIIDDAIDKLLTKPVKVVNFEIRKPNPTGGFLDTEWEFTLIKDKDGNIVEVQGVGTDITDRKQAKELIRKERDELELMIWGGRLGTWKWNIQHDTTLFNQRWLDILGLKPKQAPVTIEEWMSLIHPDDQEKVRTELQYCIEGEKGYYEFEYRKKHSSGKWIWLFSTGKVTERDKTGKAMEITGIHQDITEKKEVEEQLKLSEARNSAILQTMTEGMVVQATNGEIIFCNASAEKMLGLTKEQLMGRSSLDPRWKAIKEDGSPFPGEEHPAMVTLKTGKPQFDIKMGVQKPDGELSWILINSQLLVNPNTNEPFAVYAVFKDITELTKAHEQQTQLINLIKKQNQQLTEYAYITSHNLRSPIANLISLCQLLEKDNKPEMYVPMIAESASQLDSTIKIMNNLLDIEYDVSQLKKEPVNLKNIINHTISLLKHLITQPLNLSVEIDENLEFESNPTYINSIVYNLLSNALKFRKFGDDDFIQIKAIKTANNTLELSFEDNGIGIDLEKNRDKLFKLKSNLHSSKDGKEIGLFFTKHQIEALNGEIQIESEVGKGTKFLIIFKE